MVTNNKSTEYYTYHGKCTFDQWSRLPNQPSAFRIFTIISVLTILLILVVIGNALVIAAVVMRRRLRSATGLLILSLAVADLLVGLLVLPFSIANEVLNSFWIFGEHWCTAWLTIDIWMSTASIYNLVAISIDRYIAIIMPLKYTMLITKFRARCIVAIVWIVSFIICSPSFLLASSEKRTQNNAFDPSECRCTPSNSGMAYILFSASSSFYIPMAIVIFVYMKIYIAACAATKSAYSGMMQVTTTANTTNITTKDILMQNPSALSRVNIPTSRSMDKNSEIELRVDKAKNEIMLPESILNGSCNNLYFVKRKEGKNIHETKRLQHAATVADFKIQQISSGVNAEAGIARESPIILMDAADLENLCTSEIDAKRMSTEEQTNTDLGENETMMALLPHITFEQKNQMNLDVNDTNRSDSSHSEGVNKKRHGLKFLSRLLGRGTQRKAGCVYEKRLSVEIKAAKTVAIVTGCFIFCWLGFSVLYGISFCVQPNDTIWSIVFWLGYLNSALNPIIYTVFNREFRSCFKKLLTCNHLLFSNRAIAINASRPRQVSNLPIGNGYQSISTTPRPSQRISLPNDETSEYG